MDPEGHFTIHCVRQMSMAVCYYLYVDDDETEIQSVEKADNFGERLSLFLALSNDQLGNERESIHATDWRPRLVLAENQQDLCHLMETTTCNCRKSATPRIRAAAEDCYSTRRYRMFSDSSLSLSKPCQQANSSLPKRHRLQRLR